MHSFKDNSGREWFLKGDYLTYDRVRAATGVKLYDITTESRESLTQLADPMTLGGVLWTMIEPQATDRGLTVEDFYGAFDGTVAHDAHDALISEMIFFLPPQPEEAARADVPEGAGSGGEGGSEGGEDAARDGAGDRRASEPIDVWRLGYEFAGILGCRPDHWSLRELQWAVAGRQREQWNHTASILAQIAEVHRDPKKRTRPYDPNEIHPMRAKPAETAPKTLTAGQVTELFG